MRRIERWIVIAALMAMGLALCVEAQADEPPFAFGPQAGWQVMAGLGLSGGFGSAGGGFVPGAELSVNRLNERVWAGLYGDIGWDFGQDAALVTAGPQLGWAFVGMDGGVAARLSDGELGGAGRLLLSFGFFGLYARYIYFPDSAEHLGQTGILLKLPMWAS